MLRWKIAQWFELKWWKNYTHDKDKAAYLTWKNDYWVNLITKCNLIETVEKAKNVADLGCGPFGLALPNRTWKKRLVSVDPLLEKYEEHISFFRKSDYPQTEFINDTIEDFKSREKFDLVFCMNAINHVHDINKAYTNLSQLVQTKGTIVVSIDAHNYSMFRRLFALIPGDVLHPHQYMLEEYRRFLTDRDFSIINEVCLKKEFFFSHYVQIAVKK